jgi:hypothetical protein
MATWLRGLRLFRIGRILIYRDRGGPKAIESPCRTNAQKFAVLFVDRNRHAFRQGGAIAASDFDRLELFQASGVILRDELESFPGIRLGLATDDRIGDRRGVGCCRRGEREERSHSMHVHVRSIRA